MKGRKRSFGHSCGGKRRYRDAEQAKQALRTLREQSVRESIPFRWYQCPECGGVHVSSTSYAPRAAA